MRALDFITGHVVYNLAYNQILQTIETIDPKKILTEPSNIHLNNPGHFSGTTINCLFVKTMISKVKALFSINVPNFCWLGSQRC